MSELPLLNVIKKMEEKYIIDVENGLIKHKNINFTRKIGSKNSEGYLLMELYKKNYKIHRLIMTKYLNREIKQGYDINHINHNKSDNRICNLEETTHEQNCQYVKKNKSNTSGFKGVYYRKDSNKWRACIGIKSKTFNIGTFNTPEEAYEAWKKKARELNQNGAKYYIP